MSIIELKDLTVKYDTTLALSQVNLSIHEGEFIGIIGPNGGGKTTMVKSLLGLIQPTSGTINLDNQLKIGYVPQRTTFDMGFPISVEEVIMTGHLPKRFRVGRNLNRHEKKHAKDVMERLGIYHLNNRQIGALSGGQLQRVLIGRALMNHPNLLVLDEPVAGVDQESKEEIYKLLVELNKTMTILLITHHVSDMEEYFDRVIYINQKIHIHETGNVKNTSETDDARESCPINWYEQGNKIQKELLSKECQDD